MCIERTTVYRACNAIVVTTKVCVEYIAHTALQLDNEPCKNEEKIVYRPILQGCYCAIEGGKCARAVLMSKENGHRWLFETVEGRSRKNMSDERFNIAPHLEQSKWRKPYTSQSKEIHWFHRGWRGAERVEHDSSRASKRFKGDFQDQSQEQDSDEILEDATIMPYVGDSEAETDIEY